MSPRRGRRASGGGRWRAVAALSRHAALAALVATALIALPPGPADAQAATSDVPLPATRAAALQALTGPDPERRLAAVQRLAELGTMADAPPLARALRDASAPVRHAAGVALWAVWSRSGDAAIDRLLAEGNRLMSSGEHERALAIYDAIVRAKPAFAEGWNKRATALFLLERYAESLRDCDEVLKRNPLHFGALSGMAQIHLRRGDPEQALHAYERALTINPNLADAPQVLRLLQEAVREKRQAAQGRTT